MKELSIEEKAKAYNEALERAKKLQETCDSNAVIGWCEYIFPELKESEDERIRKALLIHLKDYLTEEKVIKLYGIPTADCIAWLERQGESYTKRDVDDAYLKGVTNTKNEIEKQYEANYQIRKDIATFIFNYKGDIKDRAKWMDYLGIKVSFVEKQGDNKEKILDFKASDWYVSKVDEKIHKINQIQDFAPKSAMEAIKEEKIDNANKVEPKDYSSIDPYFFKPAEKKELKKIEQNPVDKVEPKFHEGDWTVSNLDKEARQISEVHFDEYNSYYVVNGKCVNLEEYDRLHHLWTIADAKDGDVLASKNGENILIFRNLDTSTSFSSYYNIAGKGEFGWSNKCFIPATKEQREQLEKAMADAGFTFDCN